MITLEDLNDTWSMLVEAGATSGQLAVREVSGAEQVDAGTLFAVDAERRRHVLFPVSISTTVDEDRRSSGVHVVAHRLLDRGELKLFVDLQCRKPHLESVFSLLVMDVLADVSRGTRADVACTEVVSRWRELLDRGPVGRASLKRIAGLFGELWFLREIVRRNSRAVNFWQGPSGAPQDIVTPFGALEVKTHVGRGQRWQINGLEQLDKASHRSLYLGTLLLDGDSSGSSLNDLVDDVASLGGSRFHLLAMLAVCGVDAELLTSQSPRFAVHGARIYLVDDRIPKLIASNLRTGTLPTGIASLTYSIDLDHPVIDHLPVDEMQCVLDALAGAKTS